MHAFGMPAGEEMRLLHSLVQALQQPNKRLFRRRALFGLFKRSHARGIVALLGDMNCTPAPTRPPGRPRANGAPLAAATSADASSHPTPAWPALRQSGWTNMLSDAQPTTHRAQNLQHLDDIWLPSHMAHLAARCSVCKLLPYMSPEAYPNHLLVHCELDMGPLQERMRIGAPKLRPLLAPQRLVPGSTPPA